MTSLWTDEPENLVASGSRYLRRLARHLGPEGGVVERQLPFVGLFAFALLTLLFVPDERMTSGLEIGLATALVAALTLAARLLPWSSWPSQCCEPAPAGPGLRTPRSRSCPSSPSRRCPGRDASRSPRSASPASSRPRS